MRKKIVSAIAATAVFIALSGCAAASPSGGAVELEMWMYGSCDDDACLEQKLVDGFEAANPDITIDLIAQPGDGYYASLLSSSVTGTGPDIAGMWPGGYMNNYKEFMADANEFVSADVIAQSSGVAYFSEGNDPTSTVYAIPTNNQFYIGFYNKKVFSDAGIENPPTTWAELLEACEILKAAGVIPIVNGGYDSAQFQPLFEFSYLTAALPVEDWSKLYQGEKKWNNPVLLDQLTRWAELYANGYLNEGAFNDPEVEALFTSGQGAMLLTGGSWSIPGFTETMGDDLGVLAPPFSDEPQTALVETAGTGYAAMKYSKNLDAAGKFLAFILSEEGQQIIADSGQPPTLPGFTTNSTQVNELVAKSADPETRSYPMIDNFTQPGVTEAIFQNIAQVLVGKVTPEDALNAIDAAYAASSDEEKNALVPLFTR